MTEETKSSIQQLIRIILFFSSGFLAKYGVDTEEALPIISAAVLGVGNLGWWVYWQIHRRPD